MRNSCKFTGTKEQILSDISFNDIDEISKSDIRGTILRLEKLFNRNDMTKDKILDLVGTIFVIESLILNDFMRDERLSDLNEHDVEKLAFNLYLTLEKERLGGGGYYRLCDAADNIFDEYFSDLDAVSP